MAHDSEIRTSLVDVELLKALAPVIPNLTPHSGKAALANAPSVSLPAEIVARAKTGFSVSTEAWMNAAAGKAAAATSDSRSGMRGLTSRRWSQTVLHRFA